MFKNFVQHINRKFSFLKDKKLLIAISGGIDSVVLTHLLHQLKFNISLAHCNFKLREKESDLDQQFVVDLAKKLNTKIYTTSFNTNKYALKNKLSIQMAARELRYAWFEEILTNNNIDFVLTAHQKNDVLETFLINFTRGTGLDGLTGIPPINGNIVRPLLAFTRNDVENYAKNNNINWREDKSNASTKYYRNKIRHQIIPVLEELNPSLLQSFDKTLENLQASKFIIDDSIKNISKKIIQTDASIKKFDIEEIKKLANPKAYLFELFKKYNFTEWNDVLHLLNAQSGKQIFSKTHRLLKDRTHLLLTKRDEKDKREQTEYIINNTDISFNHNSFSLKLETENTNPSPKNENPKNVYFDKDLLKFPLTVRKWQKGDYFYPLGMQGKKKLSKFFKDEKLSLIEKENIWLLCTANKNIVWIVGKRLDNRYIINENTTKTLKITLHEKNN